MSLREVKLCGVTTPSQARTAAAAGYSHVGLIFKKESRRCILPSSGEAIRQVMPRDVFTVAVCDNPGDDYLLEIMRKVKPHFIQLDGNESVQRAEIIRHKTGARIIKKIPVLQPDDLGKADGYIKSVDYILYDVKPNKQDPGSLVSQRFDWSLFKNVDLPMPWFLSGGLNGENVQEILSLSNAARINVSSGVEPRPGRKDLSMIEEFIDVAKGNREPPPYISDCQAGSS